MPNHVKTAIKPSATVASRVVPTPDLLKSEYSSRYLEMLGAYPTSANIKTLLKELPIEKALVVPVWTRGEVAIFPGMANAKKADQEYVVKSMSITSGVGEGKIRDKKVGRATAMSIVPPPTSGKRKKKTGKEVSIQQSEEGNMKEGAAEEEDSGGANNNKKKGPSKLQRGGAPPNKATVAQKPKTETPSGRKISWSTVHTLNMDEPLLDRGTKEPLLKPSEIYTESFKRFLVPPSYRKTDIEGSISLFTRNVGSYAPRIKDDQSGDTFKEVQKVIGCQLAIRLYTKLLDYAYWNVIHPWANDLYTRARYYTNVVDVVDGGVERVQVDDDASLGEGSMASQQQPSLAGTEASFTENQREKLFLEVEEALLVMKRKIGTSKKAVSTSLQATVCLCHYLVDDMLTIIYPWFDAWEVITFRQREKRYRKKLGLTKEDEKNGLLPPFTQEELDAHAAEDDDRVKKRTIARKLRRLTHQAIADVLDPSRIFIDHMLVANYVGTDSVSMTKSSSRARFYNTSTAVRSVLGDATSDASRRFMKYADPVYVPTPGIAKPGVSAPTDDVHYHSTGGDGMAPGDVNTEYYQQGGNGGSQANYSGSGPRSLSWGEQRSRDRVAQKREAEQQRLEEKKMEENNRVLALSLVTPLSMTTRDIRRKQDHVSLKMEKPKERELTVSEMLGLTDTSQRVKESKGNPIDEVDPHLRERNYASERRLSRLAKDLTYQWRDTDPRAQLDDRHLEHKVNLNLDAASLASSKPSTLGSLGSQFDFGDIFRDEREGMKTEMGTTGGFQRGGGGGGAQLNENSLHSLPQKPLQKSWKATATGPRTEFRNTRMGGGGGLPSSPLRGKQQQLPGSPGSIGSMSNGDDLGSQHTKVENRRADFKVSVTTQGRLMSVVVAEKAAAYSDIEMARKKILLNI
jgi:hypothetical protein